MRVARSFTVLLVIVALTIGYVQTGVAADTAKYAPVLDRIMAKKELVLGTAANMPPFNMTAKDGQVIGLDVDISRLIAEVLEVKLTLKTMPFNELLPALEAGRVDMILSGMTMTPGRNTKFAFAGPYYGSGKSILIKKANVELLDEVSKINKTDNVLVALKGSTSQLFVEKVFPKAKLVLTENYEEAVKMVRESKAHAMVADQPICQLSAYRYPDAGLTSLKKTLSYEPIGIAIQANDFLFLNLLQNFIATLVNSGDLRKISDRWFESDAWIPQLPM